MSVLSNLTKGGQMSYRIRSVDKTSFGCRCKGNEAGELRLCAQKGLDLRGVL